MALETLEFDGKPYVPSKQAAETTGYTQDYIGQLARGSNILARRVGGLWYINMDSLAEHKKSSEAYVPEPPAQIADRSGSIVSFDGKEYITSKRASEITRYTQDYVGQLARSGKIGSRQVAGRWYVSKDDLKAHKEQKDALLAAVQANAVGIYKTPVSSAPQRQSVQDVPLYSYIPGNETGVSALPRLAEKEQKDSYSYESRTDISEVEEITTSTDNENATHHIAIRAMKRDAEIAQAASALRSANAPESGNAGYSRYKGTWNTAPVRRVKRKTNAAPLIVGIIAVIFIATGGYLYASGTISNVIADVGSASGAPATATDQVGGSIQSSNADESLYEQLSDRVLAALGGTLSYKRK